MNRTAFFLIATAIVYSQDCNQNNWQQYSPHLQYCDLEDVNIAWEDLSGFDFFGAKVEILLSVMISGWTDAHSFFV